MFSSLKFKIILAVIIVGSAVGIWFVYFFLAEARTQMITMRQEANVTANKELARTAEDMLNSAVRYSQAIATKIQNSGLLEQSTKDQQQSLQTILDGYGADHPEYLATYLLDENGDCIASTDKSFIGENYNFREYFVQAMQGNAHSEALMGKTSKQLGYYFSSPVRLKDKTVTGVVVAKLDPTHVEKRILSSQLAKESALMVTDNFGVILYSQKPGRLFKSLSVLNPEEKSAIAVEQKYLQTEILPLQYKPAQEAIRNYQGPVSLKFYDVTDNEQEIVSVTKIGIYPLFIISEISENNLISAAIRISSVLGVGVFLAVATAIVVMIFFLNIILKPLQTITEHAQRISKGEFNQTIRVKSGDELQILAETLNVMTTRLKGLYENLETTIKEQTKELTAEVAQLEDAHEKMASLLKEIEIKKRFLERQAQDLGKYQLAVENVSDQIVITDADGMVLYANKAAEKITGFPREEIVGTKAGVKWGKLMENELYERLWREIKGEKISFEGEFNNRRKSGEQYTAEAKISPILDNDDNVIFFVGIERDVTKLREVDRMKTEFIALASHQLRTPLSAIKWFLEMLMVGDVGVLSGEQMKVLSNVNESNERMIELVNTLLDVSRIESGKLVVDPKPTDIRVLLNGLLSELESSLRDKNQTVSVEFPPDLPEITLDPKLIRQVYMNYLTNAVKYSPPGSTIQLKISTQNNEIISEVKDEGYGIPPADRERMFQKFFRAKNITKQVADGSGLGLYLVKSIVESSGGRVWFETVEGKGTSFYFSIPFVV